MGRAVRGGRRVGTGLVAALQLVVAAAHSAVDDAFTVAGRRPAGGGTPRAAAGMLLLALLLAPGLPLAPGPQTAEASFPPLNLAGLLNQQKCAWRWDELDSGTQDAVSDMAMVKYALNEKATAEFFYSDAWQYTYSALSLVVGSTRGYASYKHISAMQRARDNICDGVSFQCELCSDGTKSPQFYPRVGKNPNNFACEDDEEKRSFALIKICKKRVKVTSIEGQRRRLLGQVLTGLKGFGLNTIKTVAMWWLKPIRDVCWLLSKLPRQNAITKIIARGSEKCQVFFDKGYKAAKKVEQKLEKVCGALPEPLGTASTVMETMQTVQTVMSNFILYFLPVLKLSLCSDHRDLVDEAVRQHQLGISGILSGGGGSGRRLMAGPDPSACAGGVPLELDASGLYAAGEAAMAGLRALNSSISTVSAALSQVADAIQGPLDSFEEQLNKAAGVADAIKEAYEVVKNAGDLMDFLSGMSAIFDNQYVKDFLNGLSKANFDPIEAFMDLFWPAWRIYEEKATEWIMDKILELAGKVPDIVLVPNNIVPKLQFNITGPLQDLVAAFEKMKNATQAELDGIINSVVSDLMPSSSFVLVLEEPSTGVSVRKASTRDDTCVTLSCPVAGSGIYVRKASATRWSDVNAEPCTADITPYVRFPPTTDKDGHTLATIRYMELVPLVCGPGSPLTNMPMGSSAHASVEFVCVAPGASYHLLPVLDTRWKFFGSSGGATDLPDLIRYNNSPSWQAPTSYAMMQASQSMVAPSAGTCLDSSGAVKVFPLAGCSATGGACTGTTCRTGVPTAARSLSSAPGANRRRRRRKLLAGTPLPEISGSAPSAGPYFSGRSSGAFQMPGLHGPRVPYTAASNPNCTAAGRLGLPKLFIESFHMDPCWEVNQNGQSTMGPSFTGTNGYTAYPDEGRVLVHDFCAWRMIYRAAVAQGPNHVFKDLLASMQPPLLSPWAPHGFGNDQGDLDEFTNWWQRRGSCEYTTDASGNRKAWGGGGRAFTMLPTVDECRAAIIGPACIFADLLTGGGGVNCYIPTSNSSAISWPLVDVLSDPDTSANQWSYPGVPNFDSACGLPQGVPGSSGTSSIGAAKRSVVFNNKVTNAQTTCSCNAGVCNIECRWAAAATCYWDRMRTEEIRLRGSILTAWRSVANAGAILTVDKLAQLAMLRTMPAQLAACHMTSSCDLATLFNTSSGTLGSGVAVDNNRFLGLVQSACVDDPTTLAKLGRTVTLSFRDSLAAPRSVSCPAGSQIYFMKVEVGRGDRITKDSDQAIPVVLANMCTSDLTSCTLDPRHPALGAQAGDVLRAESVCLCSAGFAPFAVSSACVPCDVGTYRGSNDTDCIDASPGTYVNTTGATAPVPCPAGTYSDITGSTECMACSLGYFSPAVGASNSSTCQQCNSAINEYTANVGATACDVCPPGSVLTIANVSAASCGVCRPGTYRAAGMITCTQCALGTYQAASGATSCVGAPPGSFVPTAGALASTPCPVGWYQPAENQTACLQCGGGLTTVGTGSDSASACVQPSPTPTRPAQMALDAANTGPGACAALFQRYIMPNVAGSNATLDDLMASVGDGVCDNDFVRNSAACGFDGGDCCPGTCVMQCLQSSSDNHYIALSGSCTDASFDCKDPAALNLPRLQPNCTGQLIQVNTYSALAAVAEASSPFNETGGDNVDVPPHVGTKGNGYCDGPLNNADNGWDGGDCCPLTCHVGAALAAGLPACASFDCRDPSAAAAPDTVPPVLTAPAAQTVACGDKLPTLQATVTDNVDPPGNIAISGPTLISAPAGFSLGASLPCGQSAYQVTLSWTAHDRAGNNASATTVVFVKALDTACKAANCAICAAGSTTQCAQCATNYLAVDGACQPFVKVAALNRPPVVVNSSFSVAQGSGPLVVPAPGALAGASDPDGDNITVASYTAPLHAATAAFVNAAGGAGFSISANGAFSYTPAAGFVGVDAFMFVASDGNGGLASGTVTINVTAKVQCGPVDTTNLANAAAGSGLCAGTLPNATCLVACKPAYAGFWAASCGAGGVWTSVTGQCLASKQKCAPAGVGCMACDSSGAVCSLCKKGASYKLVDGRCLCAPGYGLGASNKATTVTACIKCGKTAIQPATGWLTCQPCPAGKKPDTTHTMCI